jgi:hypothetical protein
MRQQYSRGEIAEVMMVIVAIVAFSVIILIKVPEWISPERGAVASHADKTTRTIR